MASARGLLLFLAGALLLSTLVFLTASDFFSRWDGLVAAVRPGEEDARHRRVVISTDDGAFERSWPAEVVQGLPLPSDSSQLVADGENRPLTKKSRYTLHALVQKDGQWEVVPTTSPSTLGLAVLALGLLVAGRNMVVSGVPWRLQPAERYRPTRLVPSGQAAPTPKTRPASSRQGPPPPRPQVGRGRR